MRYLLKLPGFTIPGLPNGWIPLSRLGSGVNPSDLRLSYQCFLPTGSPAVPYISSLANGSRNFDKAIIECREFIPVLYLALYDPLILYPQSGLEMSFFVASKFTHSFRGQWGIEMVRAADAQAASGSARTNPGSRSRPSSAP